MAKKQSRRTVSISRPVFDAAQRLAAERGITLAYLCELGLRSQGVDAPIGVHQTPEQAKAAMNARPRVTTGSQVIKRVAGLGESGGYREARRVQTVQRLPGPIRRALGDGIANACGEPERVVNCG